MKMYFGILNKVKKRQGPQMTPKKMIRKLRAGGGHIYTPLALIGLMGARNETWDPVGLFLWDLCHVNQRHHKNMSGTKWTKKTLPFFIWEYDK